MSDSASPPAFPIDTQRFHGELRALRTMLDASRGCFSLSFAVCNEPTLRESLIADIRSTHPGIEVIPVPPGTVDVFGAVRGAATDPARSALFVTDLERSAVVEGESRPMLRSWNASRELWERHFPCPVVFWLPRFLATRVAQHAPDLWRYRSHRFEFQREPVDLSLQRLHDNFGGWTATTSLSAEDKAHRIALLEEALAELGEEPHGESAVRASSWSQELAVLYWSVGGYHRAKEVLNARLRLARQFGDREGEAATWHQLGTIDLNEGNYPAAREEFDKSLRTNQAIGDRAGQAATWNNLGSIDLREGNYAAAREKFETAMTILQTIGDPPHEAGTWHQLATIDLNEGNYPAARQKFTKALKMWQSIGDKRGEAAAWHQLGLLDFNEGDYLASLDKLGKSLKINQGIGDRVGEAATWNNLATIDQREGRYAAAREKFEKSLKITQAIGDRAGEAATWHNLASIDLDERNYRAARDKFDKSLKMKQVIGDRPGEAATFYHLGLVAKESGHAEIGVRLLAICVVIGGRIGHGDAEQDQREFVGFCHELGYDDAKVQQVLDEAMKEYENDRGWGLIEKLK